MVSPLCFFSEDPSEESYLNLEELFAFQKCNQQNFDIWEDELVVRRLKALRINIQSLRRGSLVDTLKYLLMS